jgi:hypothetical protein
MIGSIHVPAGAYSLFTIPDEKQWTIVINKVAKQPGAFNYDEKMDVGRAPMKLGKASAPLEQLTITIEASGGNRGVLKIAWDDAVASVPIMVH